MAEADVKIYCDGGARGNPGPAAGAFLVMVDGKLAYKDSSYLGITTNNEAEYSAIYKALLWLNKNKKNIKSQTVNFFLDSELVAKQLTGEYKIKNKNLKKIHLLAKGLEKAIDKKIFYVRVDRERNKIADKLVNLELDKRYFKTLL